jgi:hypothetical protein
MPKDSRPGSNKCVRQDSLTNANRFARGIMNAHLEREQTYSPGLRASLTSPLTGCIDGQVCNEASDSLREQRSGAAHTIEHKEVRPRRRTKSIRMGGHLGDAIPNHRYRISLARRHARTSSA